MTTCRYQAQRESEMILTGPEIRRQCEQGSIIIKPWNPAYLNPNSYDLTLGDYLLIPCGDVLDVRRPMICRKVVIPPTGYKLQPGEFYLGFTNEWTESHGYVPEIQGKSTTGRYGIQVHATAGFGDDGFMGRWTLEISLVHNKPVVVYPGMRICQVLFSTKVGERMPYKGRYQNQQGAEPPGKPYPEHVVVDG